jgi:hypothetical protein
MTIFEQLIGGVLAILLLLKIAKRLDALLANLQTLLQALKKEAKHG